MNFLFLFSLLLACSDKPKREKYGKESKPAKALLVGHVQAQKSAVAKYLELTGTIEGITQAVVIPPTTGTLVRLLVEEGSPIQKDQVLAKLQNHNIDASTQRAALDFQKSQAEFARIQSLYEKGAIAEKEFRESKSALDIAQIGLHEAKNTQAQTSITSPITGTVTQISAREGEIVGSSPLLTIIDLTQLRLSAMVPEKELSFLRIEQPASIISAYDSNSKTEGMIHYISPIVDSSSGSIKIFIDLTPNQQTLRAGQFVRARIKVDEHTDTITIPKEALLYRDGQPIVYTYEEKIIEKKEAENEEESPTRGRWNKGKGEEKEEEPSGPILVAKALDVKLGYTDDNAVEILEGITLETPIITIGNTSLKEGSPILLEDIPEPTEKDQPSEQE